MKPISISAFARAKIDAIKNEHWSLVEAFFVALSLHVAFFPMMWIAGWALPWPKAPIVTTIIEYDLRGWTGAGGKMPRAKHVFDIMDPDLNK